MVTTTFCVSGSVLVKAGEGINTNLRDAVNTNNIIQINGDYIVDQWIVEAENFINVLIREDFTAGYSSLTANTQYLLREAAANLAAMYCILYDMGGYTSRTEAETMLDVLRDGAERALGLLIDQNSITYMK